MFSSALVACRRLEEAARAALAARIARDGRVDTKSFEQHQMAAHGYAWLAANVAGLDALADWAERAARDPAAAILARLGFKEGLARLAFGIAISQSETVRPAEMGIGAQAAAFAADPAVAALMHDADLPGLRRDLVASMDRERLAADPDLDDEPLAQMRQTLRRFAKTEIAPHANDWHRHDREIPLEVVEKLAELGVFGLCVPEEYGGLGLGKVAMCVASEELSAAHLATGSLATRAEIAAELVRGGGTAGQRARWLPALASGQCLAAACFTEPDTGSDLGAIKTRAAFDGRAWRLTGAKNWATHAARADLLVVLARTDPDARDHRGLSIFLAPKPRGRDGDPFPVAGLAGSPIATLGYRGMGEYELAFDGFEVPADGLLGEATGEGFRQLMATFETARIQTAARAVGVAQAATLAALAYARTRRQFGKPIVEFPRVHGKLAAMAVETTVARLLARRAARAKDSGRRCDIEAGIAKLYAARAAWAAADDCVQIHGGNGYALEYDAARLLADARILNIFEGAAEIQANIVARGLLERRN
jgi:(2S)-methylsuccinyl-CoA dehydrogenase